MKIFSAFGLSTIADAAALKGTDRDSRSSIQGKERKIDDMSASMKNLCIGLATASFSLVASLGFSALTPSVATAGACAPNGHKSPYECGGRTCYDCSAARNYPNCCRLPSAWVD